MLMGVAPPAGLLVYGRAVQRALVAVHVGAHELAEYLRRGFVFSPTGLQEPIAQIALNPDA